MARAFIGRQDSIGIGKEATPGTAVAPTAFIRQAALTLDQKTETTDNTTALGRVEGSDDSAVTEQWAEGSVNGIVTSGDSTGLLLLNLFGSEAYALKEAGVGTHTFSVSQNTLPPALTFARSNPNASRRHSLGYQSDFQIDVKQADYAMFTSTITARTGATSTETVAYSTTESRFTSKHVTVGIASNVAGLSSPTMLQLKSLTLKISRKQDRFTPLGTIDPVSFDPEDFNVSGTLVLRYTDTSVETLGLANTAQAMRISLVNTDTTIGATSNPGLVFTLAKTRFEPITLDSNLNQVLNQTINFKGELSVADGFMIQPVLTNTTTAAY